MKVALKPSTMKAGGHHAPALVVHPAEHLREPVVKRGEEGHHHRAHHDEVEVRDDEVGVVPVHVERHGGHRDAGHAAEHDEEEEAADVDERRRDT